MLKRALEQVAASRGITVKQAKAILRKQLIFFAALVFIGFIAGVCIAS